MPKGIRGRFTLSEDFEGGEKGFQKECSRTQTQEGTPTESRKYKTVMFPQYFEKNTISVCDFHHTQGLYASLKYI